MTEKTNADTEQAGERTAEALNAIFGEASPSTVFSEPVQVGDDLVITAVAWERAGGYGFGGGSSAGENDKTEGGSGGGGGGSSQGRPVAVIRVSSAGIEVEPVVDLTKIGVTVLLGALGVWKALRR